MALFCAAIKRYSVSLLRFPLLSHIQIILCGGTHGGMVIIVGNEDGDTSSIPRRD